MSDRTDTLRLTLDQRLAEDDRGLWCRSYLAKDYEDWLVQRIVAEVLKAIPRRVKDYGEQ